MRSNGRTWIEVSEFLDLPNTTVRERYNKLIKKSTVWDEDMDRELKQAYQQVRQDMWKLVANKVGVPWRAAEDRIWDLGKKEFVRK
jgi:hypothetical protein